MIVTALNYNEFYFKQLLGFLVSLRINSSKYAVNVNMVNFPEDIIEKLKSAFNYYVFENENINLENRDTAGFMVCYSSKVFLNALHKYKEPIAWFDTDVIIRDNLNEFWSNINANTLFVTCRETNRKNLKFQMGVFAVDYSSSIIDLIEDWNKNVQRRQTWYADQEEFYNSWLKYKNEVELVCMDDKFNDVGGKDNSFSNDSVIWHSKKSHFYEPKFYDEFLSYFNKIGEYFGFSK